MASNTKTGKGAPKSKSRPAPPEPKGAAPQPDQRGRYSEVAGVLMVGLGALSAFFAFTGGENPAGAVLHGLAGSMRFLIPIILVWVGILTIFSNQHKKNHARIALIAALIVMLFAAGHIFSVREILSGMYVHRWVNFVSQSYMGAYGAGALGALLSYPLYRVFGAGGGFAVLIILIVADLILLRVISVRAVLEKLKSLAQGAAQDARKRRDEREARADEAEHENPKRPRSARRDGLYIERIAPIPQPRPDSGNDDALGIPEPLKRGRKKADADAPPKEDIPAAPEALDIPLPTPEAPGADAPPFAPDEPPAEPPARKPRRSAAPPLGEDKIIPLPGAEGAQVIVSDPPPTPGAPDERYNYPPVDLLAIGKPVKLRNQVERDQQKALKLEETLKSFGISAKLTGVAHGPAVTRFELAPAPGVKVSRITALADDIALNLEALSVRIEAPIPGKAAVGVEVPNDEVEIVPLRDVLESAEARKNASRLTVALGKDNSGRFIVADLARMPHLLIAGATGAGKSVCINSIICSILYRATPDEVRLIMIDPKVVELSAYNGIPHLLIPVVTDPKKASGALTWAVAEMGNRYKMFAERGARDMKGYNLSCKDGDVPLPQIVIIIDELADLMMVTPGEVEDSICRLAQLARAAGIHLVIATQRPSVNVITGVIKANIPSRIAFTVASQVDSRTILDIGGAEKLLGRGDMLFAPSGTNKPQRVQGAWVSDDEVRATVDYIKARHDVDYNEDVIEHINSRAEDEAEAAEAVDDHVDALLPQAIEIAVESGQASISMLQRRLRVGYARAGRLIDEMAARGIISQAEGAKPRNVLITREQFQLTYLKD